MLALKVRTLALCTILTLAWPLAMATDTKPTLDSSTPCAPPEYPRASLANEEQGLVLVGMLIGLDGKVVESKVEKSSTFRNLDKAAVNAFSKCKYKPGTKDGKPEQMWMSQPLDWKIG